MQLNFSHNNTSFDIEYTGIGAGSVKIYAVPEEYSDDGYYIAEWQRAEIEPAPACAVSDARLLCHVDIENDNNGLTMKVIEANEGASCHA